MRRLALVFLGLALIVSAWATQLTVPARIHIGDELTVFVYGDSSLSGSFTVQSDGALYLPRIGRIVVIGATAEAAQAKLVARLKSIYKEPLATLSIKSQRPGLVYVVGSGAVALMPEMDLRQVYAETKAEGEPDLVLVSVYRMGKKIATMTAEDLIHGKSQWTGPLQADDVVVIEPKPYIRVWVVGIVKAPGRIRLSEGDDIYKAIAAAGDIAVPTTAAPLRSEYDVTVRRGPDSFSVPLVGEANAKKLKLEDGDMIFVEPPAQVRVLIAGEAHTVGSAVFRKGITLGGALSATGGTNGDGTLRSVVLFRGGLAAIYDVTPTRDGQTLTTSPELEQDDVIYVPRNERVYYVFGEVGHTGRYVMSDTRTYHLADVVAEAGGVGPNGSNRHVWIVKPGIHGKLGATEYHLDQYVKDGDTASNPEVHPGDLIYVDHPKGVTATTVIQALSAAFFIDSIIRS